MLFMLKIITTTGGTLFNICNDNLDFIYGNTCTFYGIKTMSESEYQHKVSHWFSEDLYLDEKKHLKTTKTRT